MTRISSRLAVGILLVALLTVTAGCMAALSGDPDPERIADELETRHDQIDDVQGVQVTTVEFDNTTERTVMDVTERPPSESKYEVIETDSQWQSEGDVVTMSDGQMRSYDAEENTVTEFEFDFNPQTATFGTTELIEETLDNSEVSYEGSDTVADRSVYVISLTDNDMDSTTTLWVDKEFWYPLKTGTTFEAADTQMTSTMTYEEVEFNQGLPDSAFEFEPPADATVEEFEAPEAETHSSIEAVDAATAYDVPEPVLADGFSFDEARTTDTGDDVMTHITYIDGDETIHYSITAQTDIDLTGESVSIGSNDGAVTTFEGTVSVTWDCDERRYSLTGEQDRETIIDSAASVDC